jgi:ribonuclease J
MRRSKTQSQTPLVKITCYGSVSEIGGNKVMLEDGDLRLLFDFGKSFGRYNKYFDGVFTNERNVRGLLDVFLLGLVPPLRGLVREDLVPAFDPTRLQQTARTPKLSSYTLSPQDIEAFWNHWQADAAYYFPDLRRDDPERPTVDAILISHAHQDHIGDLVYVDLTIPCVSTRLTAFISKVLVDIGGRSGAPLANRVALSRQGMLTTDRGSTAYIGRPWLFVDAAPPSRTEADTEVLGSAGSFWASSPNTKELQLSRFDELPAGGKLSGRSIRHWPVDHSIPGSVGYAVETLAGWVAYSGDLRMHGKQGDLTRAFAQALAELKPVALLCEGTRLTEPNRTTEAHVHGNCLRQVKHAVGRLVIADFAPRNIERLLAFADIAEQTHRTLLLQPRDAYLLRAIHLAAPTEIPDIMQYPRVALFPDPKATEGKKWERVTRTRYKNRIVSLSQIQHNLGDYILAFSLSDLADLNDLQFLTGGKLDGLYIFSNSPAYDEEQQVDLDRLWYWTKHLGMELVGLQNHRGEWRPEPGYHASGHAGADDLVEFVRIVNPRQLIPIHTEVPDKWRELLVGTNIQVTQPTYAQPISIDG